MSQDTLYKISGKVIDVKTKQPIANVSVQIYETLWGTATDSNGFFKLSVKENTALLKFLIVGYEDKIIKLSDKNYTGFVIALSQKTQQLKEIVINSSPIETIVKSEDSNVLDYDFYDDNILMITYRNDLSKAYLFLLNPAFDTLSRLKLPAEPVELFKDCMGNNHVVCQKDIYQIYLDSTLSLKLLPPKDIKTFAALLYSCVAQDSLNLYIIKKQGSQLINAHVGADY
ncbi:MAG TPA: carboxypeptidase-like regulatory domain-containing protein, partial [Bacteroidia bacterium]|nr:carboxypeptidase-like regulatory domain-containing protein [Bacteroidia bacterium]